MILAAILTALAATAITTMCLCAANRPCGGTRITPAHHIPAGHRDPGRRDHWTLTA